MKSKKLAKALNSLLAFFSSFGLGVSIKYGENMLILVFALMLCFAFYVSGYLYSKEQK